VSRPATGALRRDELRFLILFNDVLQPLEGGGPQLGEHLAYRVEALGVERIQTSYAVTAFAKEAGSGEYLKVMTDGLLGGVEVGGDLTGSQLAAAHQPKDLTAMRVGERPKDDVGGVALIGCAGGRRAAGCTHDGNISAGVR
jgi:hypothetical protein